jgi:hypothetical protein
MAQLVVAVLATPAASTAKYVTPGFWHRERKAEALVAERDFGGCAQLIST